MSIGDYVRTKDGVIAKIEDIIADYSMIAIGMCLT